ILVVVVQGGHRDAHACVNVAYRRAVIPDLGERVESSPEDWRKFKLPRRPPVRRRRRIRPSGLCTHERSVLGHAVTYGRQLAGYRSLTMVGAVRAVRIRGEASTASCHCATTNPTMSPPLSNPS